MGCKDKECCFHEKKLQINLNYFSFICNSLLAEYISYSGIQSQPRHNPLNFLPTYALLNFAIAKFSNILHLLIDLSLNSMNSSTFSRFSGFFKNEQGQRRSDYHNPVPEVDRRHVKIFLAKGYVHENKKHPD